MSPSKKRRQLCAAASWYGGAPVAPVRAYGTFLSCLVTPDTRRVTFRFEPESLTRGLRYSMIGGGALVAASDGRVSYLWLDTVWSFFQTSTTYYYCPELRRVLLFLFPARASSGGRLDG